MGIHGSSVGRTPSGPTASTQKSFVQGWRTRVHRFSFNFLTDYPSRRRRRDITLVFQGVMREVNALSLALSTFCSPSDSFLWHSHPFQSDWPSFCALPPRWARFPPQRWSLSTKTNGWENNVRLIINGGCVCMIWFMNVLVPLHPELLLFFSTCLCLCQTGPPIKMSQ